MLFGGFVTERTTRAICDEPDDPNMLLYCDDADNDIPYRPQLKLSGTYPLPAGVQVSAAFQSLAGRPIGGFTTTGNKISGPGYGDTGQPGRHAVAAEPDHAFNAFNKNTELSYRSVNFATPTYLVPSSILQGRQVRIGLQMKW